MSDSMLLRRLGKNDRWAGTLKNRGELAEVTKLYTFHGSQLTYIESPRAEAIVEEVTADLRLTGTGRPNRRLAILSLLNACFEAFDNEPEEDAVVGILWPTSSSEEPKSRYKRKLFSTPAKRAAVDNLEAHGYVKFYRGSNAVNGLGAGKVSIVMPMDKLRIIYAEVCDAPFEIVEPFEEDAELVILKDANKRLEDFTDNEFTHSVRRLLLAVNKINLSHYWSYVDKHGEKRAISQSSLRLTRQFLHSSFQVYGRFHSGAQSIKSLRRKSITIDGEETVELDFNAMMPTIAYAWGGLDSDELEAWECKGDAYYLAGCDRSVVKQIFLICLNADSLSAATMAIREQNLFKNSIELEGIGDAKLIGLLISALLEKHSRIKHLFFSSAWAVLTFQESEIMSSVLELCKNFNKPVLAIHDGLVCRKVDAPMMANFMRHAFESRLDVVPRIMTEDSAGNKMKA